jgi:hypothetical protein
LGLLATGTVIVFAGFVAACSSPQPGPRSFFVFMEDDLAREGVLARCNQDRDATLRDIECTNARRAATAIALEQERERSEALAAESERKLLALRARASREAEAQRAAEAVARAAAESAYERQWQDPQAVHDAPAADDGSTEAVAVFGAPVGPVLPSMSESLLFDVYAESNGQSLTRPGFEVAAVEVPSSEVAIARPEFALEELATISRPLRADQARAIPQ